MGGKYVSASSVGLTISDVNGSRSTETGASCFAASDCGFSINASWVSAALADGACSNNSGSANAAAGIAVLTAKAASVRSTR